MLNSKLQLAFILTLFAVVTIVICGQNDDDVNAELSPEEAARLDREAEEKRRDLGKSFRARHDLETYTYKLLANVEENSDKLSEEEKETVTKAAMEVNTWIQTHLHLPAQEYIIRRRALEETVNPIMGQLEEVIDFDKDEL